MGDWDDITGRLADAAAAGDQSALEHHASLAAAGAALSGDPKDCALLGVAAVAAGWAAEAQASPGATIGLADAALLILRILTAAGGREPAALICAWCGKPAGLDGCPSCGCRWVGRPRP